MAMMFTLRQAFRSVVHAPLVSIVVVLCVGMGVGATTTMFAWIEQLVRNPLPAVRSVDRLVSVVTLARGREDSASYPEYLEWREGSTKLSGLAAFGIRQFAVRLAGEARDATHATWGLLVSDNYFDVLGIRPSAGRAFMRGESGAAGRTPVEGGYRTHEGGGRNRARVGRDSPDRGAITADPRY